MAKVNSESAQASDGLSSRIYSAARSLSDKEPDKRKQAIDTLASILNVSEIYCWSIDQQTRSAFYLRMQYILKNSKGIFGTQKILYGFFRVSEHAQKW